MKKIMNDVSNFVDDSLAGIISAHGDMLKFTSNKRAIIRVSAPTKGKVSIVTGGGYGHLPTFLGFVGHGFCDGVAVGNVFTSPSCDAIVSAAKETHSGEGVLFLFGNYMGDTMNFEMASEILAMENIQSKILKGCDDIASADKSEWESRRGVAGLFFLYKIAGAKAELLASLDEVYRVARKACENTATIGFAMSSCQLPGEDKPIFNISDNEMELGMGIHGEPGVERTSMKSSAELAKEVVSRLSNDMGLKSSEDVAVLINGLGATSREELYILFSDVKKELDTIGVNIKKVYIGEYATSMEMQGASVSLLKLDNELEQLLLMKACTPFIRL